MNVAIFHMSSSKSFELHRLKIHPTKIIRNPSHFNVLMISSSSDVFNFENTLRIADIKPIFERISEGHPITYSNIASNHSFESRWRISTILSFTFYIASSHFDLNYVLPLIVASCNHCAPQWTEILKQGS